jgi:hypothetical protein
MEDDDFRLPETDEERETLEHEVLAFDPEKITFQELEICLLSETPLYMNSMSEKARQQLLFPAPKMTQVEKEMNQKHSPIDEFASSMYRLRDDKHYRSTVIYPNQPHEMPTRLVMPSGAFKKALAQAAVDMPGAKKAQIGRLCNVMGVNVPIWGIPELAMDSVRQAGMTKTPDIRTRCYLPVWCTRFVLRHVNLVNSAKLGNLMAAAGMIVGVGDWRAEKGSGNYGSFQIVDPNDRKFLEIIKTGGVKAQDRAIDNPTYNTPDTEKLITWFFAEMKRRKEGRSAPIEKTDRRGRRQKADLETVVAAEATTKRTVRRIAINGGEDGPIPAHRRSPQGGGSSGGVSKHRQTPRGGNKPKRR